MAIDNIGSLRNDLSRRLRNDAEWRETRRAEGETAVPEPERKRVLVTFKRKDDRPDGDRDKLAIVQEIISSDVRFYSFADASRTRAPAPSNVPAQMLGYDVNQYEAPIVMAALTEPEVEALRSNDNVAAVEDDGPIWAAGVNVGGREVQVEGQPTVAAETIPAGVSQINAPQAWDATRGKVIKVAILDTGVDGEHPDIKPHFVDGASFVDSESSTKDFNGHGTHCAGTVGAALNNFGVVGVAPAAYLIPVKVLDKSGNGSWSSLIAGLDWCANKKNVHIASMSLVGDPAPDAVRQMCDAAWNKGLLLVAAAGNTGGAVLAPARYGSVIAVSAIDSSNVIAGFSCRGPEIELTAPGVNVLSTMPGGGHGNMSGTSMACPHVSGAAALALGAHRYANNVTIRRLLAWRADNLGAPGRDNLFGYGRVNAGAVATEMSPPPAIPGIP